jgi:phage antirepressor YoqD-like protein
MSSREIAELVDARHNDVVATIDRLFAKGLLRSSRETRREATGGRPIDVYDLCERDTHLVVAGYSDEHRARVIDRWQELERRQTQPRLPAVPQSFAQALRLAAEQQEQIELKEAALAAARPKVVYAEAMLNADGTVLVRDAAKTIGVPVRKLERALREKGVILPDNSPAARYVTQGYFKESLHSYDTNTHGRQLSRVARVTGRGLEFLRRFVERHWDLFAPAPRGKVEV